MGRPPKDGRYVNFYMDTTLFNKLVMVSQIEGKTKTSILEDALNQYIEPFQNSIGEISPLQAIYVKSGKSCMVLDTITIGSKEYCKIFTDGKILTVPVRDIVEK